jgi:hypothetical protein
LLQVIVPGAWRLSTQTNELHVCRGYDRFSVTNASLGNGISPCVGGADSGLEGSGYCRAGHHGKLCEACSEPQHYFHEQEVKCMPCPPASSILSIVLALLFLGPPILLVGLRLILTWRSLQERVSFIARHTRHLTGALGLVPKLKIVLSFLGIWLQVPYTSVAATLRLARPSPQ